MSRPEDSLPPDLYYNDNVSRSYTTSSRVQHIQSTMAMRALSLLDLQHPSMLLDIGCGSGLSGEILSSSEPPHTWVGLDISSSMLSVAKMTRDVEGDLLLADMGHGLPFRPGTFDGAISISAVQWLCNADSSEESQAPERRLKRFFTDLFAVLKRGARAVLQFYPRDATQRDMICKAAIAAGFGAGVLEDDGGTKNAKLYLVCTVGGGDVARVVNGMDGVEIDDARKGRQANSSRSPKHAVKGSKSWILKKKGQMEMKGKIVKPDSMYTGRRRPRKPI